MNDDNQPTSAIELMRRHLRPEGTIGHVRLHIANYGYVDGELINRCLDELEMMPARVQLGQPPTALEQLAYIVLCDSAYIAVAGRSEA